MAGTLNAAQGHQATALGEAPLAEQIVASKRKARRTPGRLIGRLRQNQGRRNNIQALSQQGKLRRATRLFLHPQTPGLSCEPGVLFF